MASYPKNNIPIGNTFNKNDFPTAVNNNDMVIYDSRYVKQYSDAYVNSLVVNGNETINGDVTLNGNIVLNNITTGDIIANSITTEYDDTIMFSSPMLDANYSQYAIGGKDSTNISYTNVSVSTGITSICASATGQYVYAVKNSSLIYSVNYGANFYSRTLTGSNLYVTCDGTGKYVYICSSSSTTVQKSTDYGVTFSSSFMPYNNNSYITTSITGKYVALVVNNSTLHLNTIYYSSDYGQTYITLGVEILSTINSINSLCMSRNGKYLTYTISGELGFYYISNYGASFQYIIVPGQTTPCTTAAIDYDGSNIYAVCQATTASSVWFYNVNDSTNTDNFSNYATLTTYYNGFPSKSLLSSNSNFAITIVPNTAYNPYYSLSRNTAMYQTPIALTPIAHCLSDNDKYYFITTTAGGIYRVVQNRIMNCDMTIPPRMVYNTLPTLNTLNVGWNFTYVSTQTNSSLSTSALTALQFGTLPCGVYLVDYSFNYVVSNAVTTAILYGLSPTSNSYPNNAYINRFYGTTAIGKDFGFNGSCTYNMTTSNTIMYLNTVCIDAAITITSANIWMTVTRIA